MPSDKLPALPPRPRTFELHCWCKKCERIHTEYWDAQDARIAELVSCNEAADKWVAAIYKIIGKPSTSGAPLPSLVADRIAELARLRGLDIDAEVAAISRAQKAETKIAELEREIRELQKTLLEAICEFPLSCQKNAMDRCACRKCVIERSYELLQSERNAERENGS